MAYHAESPTFQRDAIASLVLLSQNLLEWSGLPAVWRRSRSGRKPAVWGASLGVALFIWSCDIQPQQTAHRTGAVQFDQPGVHTLESAGVKN